MADLSIDQILALTENATWIVRKSSRTGRIQTNFRQMRNGTFTDAQTALMFLTDDLEELTGRDQNNISNQLHQRVSVPGFTTFTTRFFATQTPNVSVRYQIERRVAPIQRAGGGLLRRSVAFRVPLTVGVPQQPRRAPRPPTPAARRRRRSRSPPTRRRRTRGLTQAEIDRLLRDFDN